jgi:site-specific DNA-methyltransferase (adenine-specific)
MSGLPDRGVHCIVTSPPYYRQRDYGTHGQIGREVSAEDYLSRIGEVLRQCLRVIRDDGVMWLNCGDTYDSGNLLGMPWRLAFLAKEIGWTLRQDVIWSKKTPMPAAAKGRCVTSHEYVFLLSKSDRYYFDQTAIAEPASHGGTKGRRSVWSLASTPFGGLHFATMPRTLAELCLSAGASLHGCCPECKSPWSRTVAKKPLTRRRPNDLVKRRGTAGTGNRCRNTVAGVETITTGWEPACKCERVDVEPCVVLDPFAGSGTTLAVAASLGMHGVGIEISPEYAAMARERCKEALNHVGQKSCP